MSVAAAMWVSRLVVFGAAVADHAPAQGDDVVAARPSREHLTSLEQLRVSRSDRSLDFANGDVDAECDQQRRAGPETEQIRLDPEDLPEREALLEIAEKWSAQALRAWLDDLGLSLSLMNVSTHS